MKWYETPSVVKFAGGKFYLRFSRIHGHDFLNRDNLKKKIYNYYIPTRM